MSGMDGSDAVFRRGIQLLNSNAEGSVDQMRLLLEEAIKQRYGSSRTLNLKKDSYVKKEAPSKASDSSASKKSKHAEKRPSSKNSNKKKEGTSETSDSASASNTKYGEKRSCVKKISEEWSDVARDGSSSHKSSDQIKSSHSKTSSSNPTSPHSHSMGKSTSVPMNLLRDIDSSKDDSRDDDDDLALEILEEDLTCVICRGMDVGVRNQLVECLECHSLYHQECHQPPVPDDMNEPRSAWYCSNCLKAMNKSGINSGVAMSSLVKGMSGIAVGSTSLKSHHSSASSKSGSGSSTKGFRGLHVAPVNKTLPGGSSSTSSKPSSSTSGASSKNAVPKINIVSADKRLAIMKKRAAVKRKLSK